MITKITIYLACGQRKWRPLSQESDPHSATSLIMRMDFDKIFFFFRFFFKVLAVATVHSTAGNRFASLRRCLALTGNGDKQLFTTTRCFSYLVGRNGAVLSDRPSLLLCPHLIAAQLYQCLGCI